MVSKEKRTILFPLILFSVIIFTIFVVFHSMTSVIGQSERGENTTVNITIRGYLDNIIVKEFPVNFTVDIGLAPGTDNNPKWGIPYLNISTGKNTNVKWNVSMNASSMTDSIGHFIPVKEIKVNYSCFTDGSQIDFPDLTELSYNLQSLCGDIGLTPDSYALIYFYLDVPAGQYNSTYYGDLWFHVNSSEAMTGEGNNRSWYGPNNTTVTIKKRIDIKWTLTPINFGIVNPGTKVNATKNQGWPTNVTIGSATNVPVDLYINGTDLNGPEFIDSQNITYSNATSENEWPFIHSHLLNNTLPSFSTKGDFTNWGSIPNNTDVFSYWEMNVPNVAGGDYSANVIAKAIEAGGDPTNG